MTARERVARAWHEGSDHAADGVPFGGPLCNCDQVAGRIIPILREAEVAALRSVADWLDGGTPRAFNFQHPCDPPGTRWEPTAAEEAVMRTVDAIRDVADDKEDRHVDQ